MDNILTVLTLCSALGCGLNAGIFFAFSAFVMRALARIEPGKGIAAMQSINITVLNPWFFTAFFGTAAACILLVISALLNWHQPDAIYLLIGSLLYLIGTVLVTIAFNVPLNDALATVEPSSAEAAGLWPTYLASWTAWNHVRTAAALLGAASLTLAPW